MTKPGTILPLIALLAAGAALALLAAPAPAEAKRGLEVGFVGDQFGSDLLTSTKQRRRGRWWDRLAGTNSSIVRINLYWNQVAGSAPPERPTDPGDPSYDWTIPDGAVREAAERGLPVAFTVVGAPRWAEGANPPPEDSYRVGSWKPNPRRFGEFGEAAARRYSGRYEDLPRVKHWEAWNEPNLPRYLEPQWSGKSGKKPKSPKIYRRMLNRFYEGVKSVKRSNKVVAAGTSPFGDRRGGKRMRPYYFWREVLCLRNREKLKKKKGCARGDQRAHMDVYAHNPINARKGEGPATPPPHPDDGVPANFDDLGRIVRKAEKRGTILPKGRNRPGWATETWYESRPPERKAVGLRRQARFMQQALYVLWRQRAAAVFFLQLRDADYDPKLPALVGFQTGVYRRSGKSKPALEGVRFPFVADRRSRSKVLLWGKAPRSGRLRVTRKGDGARRLASFRVREGEIFRERVELRRGSGKHRLRAKVGGERSLPWKLR